MDSNTCFLKSTVKLGTLKIKYTKDFNIIDYFPYDIASTPYLAATEYRFLHVNI